MQTSACRLIILENTMTKRIIIIDDDATHRLLYKHRLQSNSEVEIIGEFENAEEALDKIPHLKPNLVITDYKLPGMSGIDVATQLKQYSEIKVVLVSNHNPEYFSSVLKTPVTCDIIQKDWSKGTFDRILGFCR
jgi:DNA-binding NarL/FixJ family response regulator